VQKTARFPPLHKRQKPAPDGTGEHQGFEINLLKVILGIIVATLLGMERITSMREVKFVKKYVLAINPGSTSTKVALFKEEEAVMKNTIDHSTKELEKYNNIAEQYELRKNNILQWMTANGVKKEELKAVVGRGGLLRPMPGGTYKVTPPMEKDLKIGYQGEHASNLGGLIAKAIGEEEGVPSFIVDPVAVDEFTEEARISGIPQIQRRSLGHALNIKAVGHRVANELGKTFQEVNLVVAHLGGGISVAPVKKGRILDYNNANEMGPFSPERTGGLPVGDLAKLCFSGEYDLKTLKTKLRGKGGISAYLGTNDAREVEAKIKEGDQKAKLIYDAMGYQIAKEIAAMATVLEGKIDAVVVTGGIAHSDYLMNLIKEHVAFLGEFFVHPGEDEMQALNEGALRVLMEEEEAKIYEEEVNVND